MVGVRLNPIKPRKSELYRGRKSDGLERIITFFISGKANRLPKFWFMVTNFHRYNLDFFLIFWP